MRGYVVLDGRGVVALTGDDRVTFLQGLVSNDVRKVDAGCTVYAAFLTAQGKYLHDFFITQQGEALLLDVEAARRDDLLRRLKMYKLRAQVTLTDATAEVAVVALMGADVASTLGLAPKAGATAPFLDGLAFIDPRLPELGVRALLPLGGEGVEARLRGAGFESVPFATWDDRRLELGVPDGGRDLVPDRSILLESNLDDLNAISWDKGCYLGQELTARTRYRGLVKKRLFPVTVDGPLPAPGTPVMLGDKEAGEVRSGVGQQALALLRLDEVRRAASEGLVLLAGESRLFPHKPAWATF
ncbi:MAG TPA: folate-binding protein [Azospirillaceae bacterium]|nr:folate-binding protein [Azospirillaceae bacterium]